MSLCPHGSPLLTRWVYFKSSVLVIAADLYEYVMYTVVSPDLVAHLQVQTTENTPPKKRVTKNPTFSLVAAHVTVYTNTARPLLKQERRAAIKPQ